MSNTTRTIDSSIPTTETRRVVVPEMEELIGHRFRVLDQGFIRVVDYMGSDASVVQAARISYGAGTKSIHEDRGLIRYLMRHRHTTPLEMAELKIHIRIPMDAWRQMVRHRTASINEYSTRYSEAIDAMQETQPNAWRLQSDTNKQGSGQCLRLTGSDTDIGYNLSLEEKHFQEHAQRVYKHRIGCGIAREQARKDLPLSTYTEAYWKVDLHNLLHFLGLRMDSHAQHEIREYANIIGNEIVAKWCPLVWEAFQDYRVQAKTFSRQEMEILAAMLADDVEAAAGFVKQYGFLKKDGVTLSREGSEFEAKMEAAGAVDAWRAVMCEVTGG